MADRDVLNPTVEALAAVEHDRWSKWQSYLHSLLTEDHRIPTDLIDRWERQIATPYADLWETEKVSDRIEAERTLEVLRSLPVEQRMEAMGMEEVGEYDENGVWRSFGYWEEADARAGEPRDEGGVR